MAADYKEKACSVCGDVFKPTSPKQKTCTNEECKRERKRRTERDSYKSKKKSLNRYCNVCGKEFTTSDSRKKYCGSTECDRVRRNTNTVKARNKDLTKEQRRLLEIKAYFSSFGYTVLSRKYKGCREKLKYRCPVGHINSMTPANFRAGKRCPDCRGVKKHTLEFIRGEFEKEGYALLSDAYLNEKQKLEYICPEGHRNTMCWGNFRAGRRCPECRGAKKYEIEEIRDKFRQEGYNLISNEYIGVHSKLDYVCPSGHEGRMSWNSFNRGHRCPECYGNKKLDSAFIREELSKYGYSLLSEYGGSGCLFMYMCDRGHTNTTTWDNFKAGHRCPSCYGNKKKTLGYIKEAFSKEGYELRSTEYVNNKSPLEYICSEGHNGGMSWSSFKTGCRCLECGGRKPHDYAFVKSFFDSIGYDLLSTSYENARTNLEFKCPNGHTSTNTFDNIYNKGHRCGSCNTKTSRAEKEICEFVKDIVGEDKVVENARNIISPYELDIYVPDKELAIEYCGLYWHSEVRGNTPRPYHYDKMKMCNDLGIRLITIFEDEYRDKPLPVRSRIQNALGTGLRKIYARKCEVKELTSRESNDFLSKYHLQGKTGARVRWGLYYEGELVQVLTIGAISRTHAGKLKDNPDAKLLELKRFASLPGVSVVGGASRLFKRAVEYAKENGFTHIKSYCDMRYGNHRAPVYETLGFELIAFTKWTPHYVRDGKRYRNQGLRKTPEERLTGKTEWQLRFEMGYDRLFDTGHRTYLYTV